MKDNIIELAREMQSELVELRRDFHRHAESAWTEFRTASIVASKLEQLGYEVSVGSSVIEESEMMGVPARDVLDEHLRRAKSQGATKYADKMAGGKTGVMGLLRTGSPGPVTALRFDIDANDMNESTNPNHIPVKEGFASINAGAMHACGHDGHTAIGLGLAKLLYQIKNELSGTVKIIFQPAEEGVRGAKSMVAKGIVDDVNYVLGGHIGFGAKNDRLVCGTSGFLATTKFDVTFKGVPSHAGAKPEDGKSALLSAACASLSMQGIYRHSAGPSRINIGVLHAGTGRNVVPDHAVIKVETRGVTSQINEFIKKEAYRMAEASAAMYDTRAEIVEVGGAVAGECDAELVLLARRAAEESGMFAVIEDSGYLGGSEDYTYFMERVQNNGGKALFVMIGAATTAGHHNDLFDFDERVLSRSVALFAYMTYLISKK